MRKYDDLTQYKILIESIVDYAIYMLDEQGCVTSWNVGAERVKGYAREEILGQNFSVFYSPEDRDSGLPAESLARARADGRFEAQGWRYRKGGGRFWAHIIIDPIYENNQVVGFAKVTRDASLLNAKNSELEVALAAAEAANQAKSDFLAVMSHEIRTPLNGVLGMAQAMAAGELSDVQKGRLRVILESGANLLAVLNDILELSKIEAALLQLEHVKFDFGELCRGAHATFTATANNKGVSFRLDIGSATGTYLGDPTRLRQVLYNVISNALKFTNCGEVSVTAARNKDGLRVIVCDTGIGMTEEALSQIFSAFTQADASTTRIFGGTGLGLSICKRLVELMGGEISVSSVVGEGSVFTIDIPLEYVGEAQVSDLNIPHTALVCEDVVLKVLAAEDNTVNQLVLKTLLNQVGIDPTVVSDGLQAVDAWKGAEWDVILMDVQMPKMDGTSATAEIRRLEALGGRRRTPIYALSANAMSHQVAEYHKIGMDGYISKPIEVQTLFSVLEEVLESSDNDLSMRPDRHSDID